MHIWQLKWAKRNTFQFNIQCYKHNYLGLLICYHLTSGWLLLLLNCIAEVMTDLLLLYLMLFTFQYKARCYMMLKSLKSCKRELKVLVNAVGMVSINNHMPVVQSSITDSKSSWMLCIIFLPNHCCWEMSQNLPTTVVGRWAKISQPLLLADEPKSPNHCCW